MTPSALLKIALFLPLLLTSLLTHPAVATEHLTLQLPWHHQFQFAGYYMAEAKGFFRQQGLEVEIRTVDQAEDTVGEVLSGRAAFGISSSGLLIERSLGRPVIAVAAILQDAPTIFLTLQSSGLASPADFKGKRVMLSPGYQSLPLIALLYKEQVLQDINRIETSFDVHSLLKGDTDVFNAYRSNEPYLLQSKGYSINIIDPRDYGIHFYSDILFTSESYLKQHPETVERFRTAAIKGWQYALEHIDETIALLKQRYQVTKSEAGLRYEAMVIKGLAQENGVDIGHMDLARWAQIAHQLIVSGQISTDFHLTDEFLYAPPPEINWHALRAWVIGAVSTIVGLIFFLTLLSRANYRAHRALVQLENSKTRYRELAGRVPGLIYSASLASGQVDFPPSAETVLGYPTDYLHEHPKLWAESIHPQDQPRVAAVLADLPLNKTHELEYRIRNQQGAWLWINDRFIKRFDAERGEVIDGVAIDITEKKSAQEKQQQADQLLRQALDAVSDGIWEWDIPNGTLILDDHSKELFGLTPATTISYDDILSRIGKKDVARVVAELEAHVNGHSEKFDHTFNVNRPDGSQVWIRGRGRVIERDPGGQGLRMIGTNVDVTKRILAEEKRLESEKRFRNLIEQVANLAIQGYDEQRRVIFWNKASELLYGYSEAEALGQKLEDLIIPESLRDQVIKGIQRWLTEGIPIPAGELSLIDKDGHDVTVFSSHVLHRMSTGQELFCIDIDMRPIKEAEQKRLELEEQLRQAYKMEAIGTMAGGIAHDFNNTLAIILGNVEMSLRKLPADSRPANHLRQAKTAIMRAKDLVQQILIYSRQGKHNKGALRIATVIRDVIKMLRSTIPTTVRIELAIANAADSAIVSADATQLQQIVVNLCNNAVQAMQEKGTLKINLSQVNMTTPDLPPDKDLAAGDYLLLSVADNGCGIAAANIARIFDPFFTTKEVGEGTGMGLAVVEGIVESHGGFIRVDSSPGQGTLFQVYLPTLADESLREQDPSPKAATPSRGQENILLVDDEELLLDIGRQILEEYGYRVQTAANGSAALDLIRRQPGAFDLVITDQTMPDLTGEELARKLGQLYPELPIILCSGYNTLQEKSSTEGLGIREYCQKPLDMDLLVETIRKILDNNTP